MPIVAVPTTYAGSEMTPIYGITEGGVKRTGRDRKVLPRTVIYDPELTLSLPPHVSGPSGINAIAHCVEALYAADANPITALMAEEGIRALARALPVVVREPEQPRGARRRALRRLAGAASCSAAPAWALHHKLCHTLGGTFNLPHAEVHTVILPHATAYNRDGAPEAMGRPPTRSAPTTPRRASTTWPSRIGARTSLTDIGMPADGLDRAADLAVQNQYSESKATGARCDPPIAGKRVSRKKTLAVTERDLTTDTTAGHDEHDESFTTFHHPSRARARRWATPRAE